MSLAIVASLRQLQDQALHAFVRREAAVNLAFNRACSQMRVVHRVDVAPRIAALREVMAECPAKIIIFAPLTSVLNLLNQELKEFTRAVINGAVTQKERSELFRSFQDDEKPRVLIADPATMAHGLTLTAASTIIWFAPTDRTELYLQANKRIDRPGQVRSTTIVHLAASPVEREIYRRLAANESMQGLILQLAKGGENGE
jgi:SNF2 family DNA or RNA helicase